MNKQRKYCLTSVVLVAFVMILALSACGSSTSEQLESVVTPTGVSEQKVEIEPTPAEPIAQPLETPEPTEVPASPTPRPTEVPATPTPQPEPISLIAQGFGQDEQQVGYSFVVENPNSGYAFESSQYQVAIYDADGTVAETDSGYIELVLPGQRLGIAGTMYLDEGVTASRIDVQLNAGDAEPTDLTTTFSVDKVAYLPGDYSSKMVGVITNPYDRDITDLKVSTVIYNEAGEIIGGGFTFVNFILAKGTTGASVSVTSAGEVAKVELYPAVSGLSMLVSGDKLPVGAQDLSLVKHGYGQSENQVGYGMLVDNPNGNFAVEGTMFHVTFYAEDGAVVAVEEGYVDMLLPSQTLGIGGQAYLDEGMTIASADFEIKSGRFEASDVTTTFTAENISYKADPYFPKVTGEIASPYPKDVTNLRVSAICYDEASEIIGGGFTYLDFIPANGKIPVEVGVTVAGTPATAELYAALSSLSDFE